METITIVIETGTEALINKPATEITKILRRLARDFERDGGYEGHLEDTKGETCGWIRIDSAQ